MIDVGLRFIESAELASQRLKMPVPMPRRWAAGGDALAHGLKQKTQSVPYTVRGRAIPCS